jgi:N-acetylornithine carbamoyltransferase
VTEVRHFLSLRSVPREAFEELLAVSRKMKERPRSNLLAGKSLGLLFFNRSLRTRATFEIAMFQLGGQSLHLSSSADIWELEPEEGKVMDGPAPEHVKDAALVLSSYLDGIAVRAIPSSGRYERDRADAPLHAFARFSRVPVFNMESFSAHPLQALADVLTLRETFGESLQGLPFSLVWTNHPTPQTPSVALSILSAAARLGMRVRVAHPDGYELEPQDLEEARAEADRNGGEVRVVYDFAQALEGTRVVYARSWGSRELYGQPTVEAARRAKHASWILTRDAMRRTRAAKFMHSMPVRRNVVVTDDVLDGSDSLVYLQAENRLHTLKAVLATYLADGPLTA